MKYCTKCGGEIGNYAIECGHCGYKFSAADNGNAQIKNDYSDNMAFQSFGYESPVDLTNKPDTGNYNCRSNNGNSEASKKANKTAAVIGVVFLIVVAVAAFFIVRALKNSGHKEEERVLDKWLNSVIDQDPESYIEGSLCEPLLEAFLAENEMTREEFVPQLKLVLKQMDMSNFQVKDIKVTKKTSHKKEDLDLYNDYIEEYTGKKGVINAMYDVVIEYKQKANNTSWIKGTETVTIYESNGKYYVLAEFL